MSKLVVLRISSGSFDQGFPVTLQVGEEGRVPIVELAGRLPPAPEMPLYYQHWRDRYWQMGGVHRLSAPPMQRSNVFLKDECRSTSSILRSRFHTWLQAPEFRRIHDKCLEILQPSEQIRIVLQTDHADLQKLPWHCWDLLDRYPNSDLVISPLQAETTSQPPSQPQVQVLAILGHSEGIDVQADRALLESLPRAQVTFLVEPNRQALTEELWRQPWDILFFAGHSLTQDGRGRIFINPNDSLTIAEELKYALRKAVRQGLQLAIFNSCDGVGIARDLADLRIPQTIVMREPVADRVAQSFLTYFLPAYAQGDCLHLAVRQARERLEGLEDEFPCASWLPLLQSLTAPPTWEELIKPPPVSPLWRWGRYMVASGAIAAAVLGVRHLGWLQPWELKAYDDLFHIRSTVQRLEPVESRLLVVTIDPPDKAYQISGFRRQPALKSWLQAEPSAFELNDKSLSDAALVQTLKILNQAQAAVIGLDLLRDAAANNVSPRVAQQFAVLPSLVGVCVRHEGIEPPHRLPLPQVGLADFVVDDDYVVRRHLYLEAPPAQAKGCGTVESVFSLKLAERYLLSQGQSAGTPLPRNRLQLGKAVLEPLMNAPGGYRTDQAMGYQILLNYRDQQIPSISLSEVLRGENLEKVRGKVVLIGTNRLEQDLSITPYSQRRSPNTEPGVFVQAQMTSQLLSAALGERPLLRVWTVWQEWLWIGGWAIAAGLVVWIWRSPWQRGLGMVVLVGSLGGICILMFGQFHTWIPFVPPLVAIGSVGGGAMVLHRIRPARNP